MIEGKRVGIVGSRQFSKLEMVQMFVRQLPPETVVVSGGASGVDTTAEFEAKSRDLEVVVHEAEWEDTDHPDAVIGTRNDGTEYNKLAGFWRNQDIVDDIQTLVAFWDGKSRGTKDTIDRALEADNVEMVIIYAVKS